jgi:hypothetical protein
MALMVAAFLVPGGFIALVGVWFLKALSQTERGRRVVSLARQRVPSWAQPFAFPELSRREAA